MVFKSKKERESLLNLGGGGFSLSRGIGGFNIGSRGSSGLSRSTMNSDFVAVLGDGAAGETADGAHRAVLRFGLVVELVYTATDAVRAQGETQAGPQVEGFVIVQVGFDFSDSAGGAAPGTQAADWVLETGAEVVFVTVLFEEIKRGSGH